MVMLPLPQKNKGMYRRIDVKRDIHIQKHARKKR
jgi:hypothetical protein